MDIINLYEKLAEHGHAPVEGCRLFSVGYEDAFERLKQKYLVERFGRGGSAEKFVIGPFGSGKTHFLRHLIEVARELNCVVAEVALNKDVDFTKSLIVYQEVARELRTPGRNGKGMRALLLGCMDQVRNKAPSKEDAEEFLSAWISGLDLASFQLDNFGLVARRALEAYLEGNEGLFNTVCRWLSGEVTNRSIAKDLGFKTVSGSEQNLYARRALFSLAQFVRSAGYTGTVMCFDEAEQGLGVDKRKMNQILSMLQSGINAVADLQNGSLLIVFALTPDLVATMENLEALRQRVADPGPGQGFFDGNTLAPKIDLTRRRDPIEDLRAIGYRLVEVFYERINRKLTVAKEEALKMAEQLAVSIGQSDPTSSNRRTMVKNTCARLLRLCNIGTVGAGDYEDEV